MYVMYIYIYIYPRVHRTYIPLGSASEHPKGDGARGAAGDPQGGFEAAPMRNPGHDTGLDTGYVTRDT